MTPAPASQDEDLDLAVAPSGHAICCRNEERILCGARYHPEIIADDNTEESCKNCEDILDLMACPPRSPNHNHCPFSGSICPVF